MSKLQILRKSDEEQIQKILDSAFGKISNRLSILDIHLKLKTPSFCNRIMKDAKLIITAHESLSKSYKYSKEVGCVELVHNGKVWLFDKAYRKVCYAGQSIGGSELVFRNDVKEEVIKKLLEEKNYSFQTSVLDILFLNN